jgi:hypothetical protein
MRHSIPVALRPFVGLLVNLAELLSFSDSRVSTARSPACLPPPLTSTSCSHRLQCGLCNTAVVVRASRWSEAHRSSRSAQSTFPGCRRAITPRALPAPAPCRSHPSTRIAHTDKARFKQQAAAQSGTAATRQRRQARSEPKSIAQRPTELLRGTRLVSRSAQQSRSLWATTATRAGRATSNLSSVGHETRANTTLLLPGVNRITHACRELGRLPHDLAKASSRTSNKERVLPNSQVFAQSRASSVVVRVLLWYYPADKKRKW